MKYISTKPVPLCSACLPPSVALNLISLAPLLAEIAHLVMLFILQLTHTTISVRHLKNVYDIAKKATSANNGAGDIKFGSIYGGEDGEDNGVGFVVISKIFTKQDPFCSFKQNHLTELTLQGRKMSTLC